jgi:hypothetical protein
MAAPVVLAITVRKEIMTPCQTHRLFGRVDLGRNGRFGLFGVKSSRPVTMIVDTGILPL